MGIETGTNPSAASHIARIAAEAGFHYLLATSADTDVCESCEPAAAAAEHIQQHKWIFCWWSQQWKFYNQFMGVFTSHQTWQQSIRSSRWGSGSWHHPFLRRLSQSW